MSQDYNVDDILEEIRRKKAPRTEDAPARTATYSEEPYRAPRAATPPPAAREGTRQAPARPVAGFGDDTVLTEGRRARPSAFPVRARPQQEQERPATRQYAAPERAPQQQEQERPATRQYAAPESAPRQSRFEFIDADAFPKKNAGKRQFDFETAPLEAMPEPQAAPRAARAQQFDYDSAPAVRPPRGETLADTMNRVRREEAPPRDSAGFDFGTTDESYALPTWTDELPNRANYVDPTEVPLPDGTRVDLPLSRGYTDEPAFDTPTPRPTKRAPAHRVRESSPESIVRSQWQQGYTAQDQLEQDELADDDFASPADAPYVAKDIKAIRVGLNVRLSLTVVLTAISLYLALSMRVLPFAKLLGLSENFLLPLPTAILPEKSMRLFIIVNLILCVVAAIVCSNIVGNGLATLFRMRADSDSPAALALVGVLVQGFVLMIAPVEMTDTARFPYISLYFPVALAALLCNLIGKKILISRVERNFKSIVEEGEKQAFVQLQNRDFAREFAKGLGPDVDRVAYTARTDFLSGFLNKSYSPDYSGTVSRILVPISFVGGVAVAGVTFFLARDAAIAFSAFAAVLCVTAPFSSALVPQLMLAGVSKSLTRKGAMLAGYESAEDFSDTGAVIINDRDLFADDCVMLHGMKVFAEKRIDEAILDAASVILSCDGIMSGVFLNMIGGNKRLLKKVDSLLYEDSMGISAWVDGKRVLIGSRALMDTHDIGCPSRDFEGRYTRDGRQVLYIANSGELSAMFVVSYNASPDAADALAALERRGVSAIVYTTDPNVTTELVAAAFGVKRAHVKVLPAKLHPEYAYLVKPKEQVAANGAYTGGLRGILRLLRAASAVKHSVMQGTIAQLIGVIVGYALVALLAFTGSLSSAAFGTLLLFNCAWLVITVIATLAVKR